MSDRLTRPLYVLAHPADSSGCGHHRIMRPLEILSTAGFITGRADMNVFADERLSALAPDIIVWQRQHNPVQIEQMKRSRDAVPGAYHIYEIDDCMSAVPDWSPHKPDIPYDIDDEMAKAVAVCDAVTVSTQDLADHMRSISGPDTDIRVTPNMLANEELARVEEIRSMKMPGGGKFRIGWGGGHSHKADLDIIIPAMRELQDRVEWVFCGQKPECEMPVEYCQGVSPKDFLPHLAAQRIDLMIAPLVDCKFNRCKSNLRLLEAGALGLPVIASPVGPYHTKSPPVVYAETPDDWLREIQHFMADREFLNARADAMKQWMRAHFVMDDHLEERLRAWMPRGKKPFLPKNRALSANNLVVFCSAGKRLHETNHRVVTTLREACEAPGDVVYIRPTTSCTDEQLERLWRHLNQGNTCSVCPMSNDGGSASFPTVGQYTALDPGRFDGVDGLCKRLFGPVRAEVTNPAGPVMVLSKRAMELCGYPDYDNPDPEAALVEWGVLCMARGFQNVCVANTYVTTGLQHGFSDVQNLIYKCQSRYQLKQLPQDPMGEVRSELELAFHREFYDAPLPSANATYAEWAALFNEVGERDLQWMEENFPKDVKLQEFRFPLSTATLLEAMNAGVEWGIFANESTLVQPHARYLFAEAITKNPAVSVCYADHDFMAPDGTCDRHDFKPVRLDLHLLYQRDYVTQICAVYLPELLAKSDELPGVLLEANLYGLLLDIIHDVGEGGVKHIPRVLAHLAPLQAADILNNVIMKCSEAQKRVAPGAVVTPCAPFPMIGAISYAGVVTDEMPLVSIIILSTCQLEIISPALDTILAWTDYPNFEIILVENGKPSEKYHEYIEGLTAREPRLRRLRYEKQPFNWSKYNNWAARKATGEYLLLLNDDIHIRIQNANWLREMVGCAMSDSNIGAVGARLLYPWGLVQHVGVVSRDGMCGHIHKGLGEFEPGYNGIAWLSHQSSAVTGACLLVKKSLYDEVGGLNEKFAMNFNDIAFCLELDRRGYRNVSVASAMVNHMEGVTRHSPGLTDETTFQLQREALLLGKLYPGDDPYWNPNLHFAHLQKGLLVLGLNYDQLSWPAASWSHRGPDWPKEKLLLLGDDGTGWVQEARNGSTLYFAAMQGYTVQLVRPALNNIRPFDIREPTIPQQMLDKLGVTKIVVRSILGSMAEALPFILKLGLPVEYRPLTGEAACPRADFKTPQPDGSLVDCQDGWRRGACQTCLLQGGSPFGAVSITGWRDQWRRFFDTADFTAHPNESINAAIKDIYPKVAQA